MDSLGPHSVLDRSDRHSLQHIVTDRVTRHRSPGRSVSIIKSDEDIVVETRIPQPYRTSFSAVTKLTRKERSRSLSPASSLKSSRHSSKGSWSRRNASGPKHVTYDSVVTVRHSDTFDTVFSSDTQFSDAENITSSSQENSTCESLSDKQESDHAEQLRTVSRQIQKEYSGTNTRYVSIQFPNGKTPISCNNMKNLGQDKGRKVIQKDYLHDRTISYRRAVQIDSLEDVVPIVKESQTPNAKSISSPKAQNDLLDEHEASSTPQAVSKRTFSNNIGNFFRRISPRMSRKQSKDKDQTSSAQSLSSDHSLESDKRSRRGSQERIKQSLKKLIGRSRSGSHSGSKSEKIPNSNMHQSPSVNISEIDDTKTAEHSYEAKSVTSFNRILKSIEQNSMTEAAVYQKFKEKQMPSKQGEVTVTGNSAGKTRAIKPVASESFQCVSNSKINKENEMITQECDRPEDVHRLLTSQHDSDNMHTNNLSLLSTDESIGDCSLDINCTDKDASLLNESDQSVASCRVVPSEELMTYQPTAMSTTMPSVCIGQKVLPLTDSAVTSDTNIQREDDFSSEEFVRTPSYLKVSRAVGGYGLYSHYGWYKNIEKRSPCSSSISLHSVSSQELPMVSSQENSTSDIQAVSPLDRGYVANGHSTEQKMVNGHLEHIYPTGDPVKDGNYYLDVTQTEEERLLVLIGRTERDMACSNLTEEVNGRMRAAVGKANLLIRQKFPQFRKLCALHMHPSETERCTKWEDLQGFWDMVKIQVDNIDELFMELDFMKQNDWKEISFKSHASSANSSPKSGSLSLSNASTISVTPGHTPGSKRKVKDTVAASPELSQKAKQTAKLREEARKRMLAERRSTMKQKSQQALQEVEIFLPVTNKS